MVEHPHRDESAHEHWESRYAGDDPLWSGTVNPTLAAAIDALGLTPGNALDLGCGEGGDAIWLARQGWQVHGIDISATALARAGKAAESAGVTERTTWQVADLAEWVPEDTVDLVCSAFMHSPVGFDRVGVLRRGAHVVRPGGHLVVVTHYFASADDLAPWMGEGRGPEHLTHLLSMPAPVEEATALALGPDWQVLVAEPRRRLATSPDQRTTAWLTDGLLVLRRDDNTTRPALD